MTSFTRKQRRKACQTFCLEIIKQNIFVTFTNSSHVDLHYVVSSVVHLLAW